MNRRSVADDAAVIEGSRREPERFAVLFDRHAPHIHRYLARRARNGLRRGGPGPRDPALALPPAERRAVRAYSWLLLAGTAACIAMAVVVTIPATVVLVAHAAGEVGGRQPVDQLDGLAAVLVLVGLQFLWLRTWWRRHGGRVRGYLRSRFPRSAGGGDLDTIETTQPTSHSPG